jgi:hypothetical protein
MTAAATRWLRSAHGPTAYGYDDYASRPTPKVDTGTIISAV